MLEYLSEAAEQYCSTIPKKVLVEISYLLLNLPCKFSMQVNMGAVMLFWSRMIGLFLTFYSFFLYVHL
jgi:hypothetical protein